MKDIFRSNLNTSDEVLNYLELLEVFNTLSERQKAIIGLYCLGGYTQNAIGELLNIKRPLVGLELRRAISILRTKLGAKPIAESDEEIGA